MIQDLEPGSTALNSSPAVRARVSPAAKPVSIRWPPVAATDPDAPAKQVVHGLEAIEVDVQQSYAASGAVGGGHRLPEPPSSRNRSAQRDGVVVA